MKTYEEVKAQFEKLDQKFQQYLEEAAFGDRPFVDVENVRKQRNLCAELMQLRLYSPLFGSER